MKFINNLKRYIVYFDQSPNFYFYVMLFCIVLVGIFGIVPLTNTIFKKVEALNRSSEVLRILQEKENTLKDISTEYDQALTYVTYLDTYMPQELNLEDYLVSINEVAAENEFVVRRVTPKESSEGNYVDVQLTFEGSGNVTELVTAIESLKRVTRLDTIEITNVKGIERINIYLRIYYK